MEVQQSDSQGSKQALGCQHLTETCLPSVSCKVKLTSVNATTSRTHDDVETLTAACLKCEQKKFFLMQPEINLKRRHGEYVDYKTKENSF